MYDLIPELKELELEYLRVRSQLARQEAKSKMKDYTEIVERFDKGFSYFFDADEIRSKYDPSFNKTNLEIFNELDYRELKEFIKFTKEYIEYLEKEIEQDF